MRRITLLISLLICFLHAEGKDSVNTDSLTVDLNYLYASILEIHPDPFMNISSEGLSTYKNRLAMELGECRNVDDFFFKVARFTALLKDGHTTVIKPTFAASKALRTGNVIFPVDILIKDDKCYAAYDHYANDSINREILSINAVPMREMMEKVFSTYSYDIYMDPNYTNIEDNFYAFLNVLCGTDSVYTLQLEGVPSLYHTKGINMEQLVEARGRAFYAKEKPFGWKTYGNKVVARIANFIPSDELYQFIDSLSHTVCNTSIDTLVIDIRDNKGGSSVGVERLLSHLAQSEYKIYDSIWVKSTPFTRELYKKKGSSLYDSLLSLSDNEVYLTLPTYQAPSPVDNFRGEVIVLVNKASY
ncbi:MAG: hypothetical protein LBM62_03510 [Mediterranea sp.]|jgi:hypothetical protein|nr:hypothetical protein [Mediterranea sp.]